VQNAIVKPLQLRDIRLDQRAQPRAKIDEHGVDEYAHDIEEGAKLPPIMVFYDGTQYWLADGFHRYHAHQKISAVTIRAEVREGTLKDAILYSVSANTTHGLRRSNEDKRRAVRTMLEDEEWKRFSDAEVAARCHVSRPLVATVRKELETEQSHPAELQDRRMARRRGKVYPMDLARIRRKSAEKATRDGRDTSTHGSKSPSSTSQSTETEEVAPVSVGHEEPAEATLRLLSEAEAIESLRQIYAGVSALPTAQTMADFISKHETDFSELKAIEVSRWFSALAHFLGDGPRENLTHLKQSVPLDYSTGLGK
jgi:ParB-like chromosome segregation protein Spo0J